MSRHSDRATSTAAAISPVAEPARIAEASCDTDVER
jgi:hypothetical protein